MSDAVAQFLEKHKVDTVDSDVVTRTSEESQTEAKKYLDPVGVNTYGIEHFSGFQKVAQITPYLPSFKDFYYAERIKTADTTPYKILKKFNEEVLYPMGAKLHPYPNQIRGWFKKWDADIFDKMKGDINLSDDKKRVLQVVNTRNADDAADLEAATEEQLEKVTRMLGGELLNDAISMLRDDQQNEETQDGEIAVKRRKYVVDVFAQVTKMLHGKATIALKQKADSRDQASFMMNLLGRAASGTLTTEEFGALKSTYVGTPHDK